VIRHDVTAIGEGFAADSPFSFLLGDLVGEQFLHFSRRSDFTIASGMVWIFNARNTRKDPRRLPSFASAPKSDLWIEQRSLYRSVRQSYGGTFWFQVTECNGDQL
jgi:hypothetical protein